MVHERTQKRAIDCLRPRRANRHVQAEPWRPAFCVDAVTPGREYRLDRRDLSALGPTGARVTLPRRVAPVNDVVGHTRGCHN